MRRAKREQSALWEEAMHAARLRHEADQATAVQAPDAEGREAWKQWLGESVTAYEHVTDRSSSSTEGILLQVFDNGKVALVSERSGALFGRVTVRYAVRVEPTGREGTN